VLATYILCVYHIINEFPFLDFKTRFQEIFNTQLNLQITFTNNPKITPKGTKINPSIQWSNITTYINSNNETNHNMEIPTCPTYNAYRVLKFSTNSYYIPPNPNKPDKSNDVAGYGIYNKDKNIKLAFRLPRLQNILKAELTAIHDTLQLTIKDIEPTYIFNDSLNLIYLINTQLQHSTTHNNHLKKLLLQEIAKKIINKTSPLYIHKVKAHKGILDNKEVDKLAKKGIEKDNIPFLNNTITHTQAHIGLKEQRHINMDNFSKT
jgi:ribonuclease HI